MSQSTQRHPLFRWSLLVCSALAVGFIFGRLAASV